MSRSTIPPQEEGWGPAFNLDASTLDRGGGFFSESPPPYIRNSSGTPSPELSIDERRQRIVLKEQQFRKRMIDYVASRPYQQFLEQVEEEKEQIWKANPRKNKHRESHPPFRGLEELQAIETIKKRWVEQGIWKDRWDNTITTLGPREVGGWKHEKPLKLESESETDTEPESLFSVPQPNRRRPKSDKEKARIAERRVIREREYEASRPYHQFLYQISKERERIQGQSGVGAADINTRAYETVRDTWVKRGLWRQEWGILPGMSWMHEIPWEEFINSVRANTSEPTREG